LWLKTAYRAASYSLANRGVLSSWLCGDTDRDFYDCVCLAIAAHRRHTQTDYDALLAAGVPRDEAREITKN
jgi:hypothetical protein